jgi:hypothetical protein
MSYGDSNERVRSGGHFRTIMDIMMGIFYTWVGGWLIYARSFFNMQVPTLVAYILGGMMVIGGLFRLFRGVKAALPGREREE